MVTRLLLQGGLYLGEESNFVHAEADNPDGYFEHSGFLSINERILETFGGGWDAPPEFPENWASNPKLDGLRAEADALVKTFTKSPWGWKDPRSSLTLEFWREVIPDLQVVLCVRNPLDVCASLNKRGYASKAFGRNLWLRYNKDLLAASSSLPTLCTHYSSYFYDAGDETARLFEFCGLKHDKRSVAKASALVQSKLRHANSNIMESLLSFGLDEDSMVYLELCHRAGPVFNKFIREEMQSRVSGAVDQKIGDLERELRTAGEGLFKQTLRNDDLTSRVSALQERVFKFEHYPTIVNDLQHELHLLRVANRTIREDMFANMSVRDQELAEQRQKTAELAYQLELVSVSPQMVWGGRVGRLRNMIAPAGSTRSKIARFFFRGFRFLFRKARRLVRGGSAAPAIEPPSVAAAEPDACSHSLPTADVSLQSVSEEEHPVQPVPEEESAVEAVQAVTASKAEVLNEEQETRISEIVESILNTGHKVAVSISHDDFVSFTGGVQKVIREQCKNLISQNITHLHFCPRGLEEEYLVTVNAERQASLPSIGLLRLVEGIRDLVGFIEIHHMMGMDLATVDAILESAENAKHIMWIHDYFTACPSYTLLRNGRNYCGAPPIESHACIVCSFHGAREVSYPAFKRLLNKYKFLFVTPSEASRDVWLRAFPEHRDEIQVLPLYSVSSSEEMLSTEILKGTIRVAYPGDGRVHKGYAGWRELVKAYEGNKKYNFFHFGLSPAEPVLRFRQVTSTDDELSPMTANLRENLIDVAVICPIWPETFNIVAHEAYAAGCFIVTCAVSGNVPRFVEQNKCGVVLATPADVLAYFEDWERVAEDVREFRDRLKVYPRLTFNIDQIANLYT